MIVKNKYLDNILGRIAFRLFASLSFVFLFSCADSIPEQELTVESLETNSNTQESDFTGSNEETFTNSVTNIEFSDDKALLFVGDYKLLSVFAALSDGKIEDVTSQIQWKVSPSYLGNIILNEPIRFTALSQGQGEIIASLGSRVATLPLTVITNSITSIQIEAGGVVLGAQATLTANAIFEDGSAVDISNDVTWASTDPDVVEITQNPTFITPVLLGETMVTASYEGFTGSKFLNVAKTGIVDIRVEPVNKVADDAGVIKSGKTGQMKVYAIFDDGHEEDFTEYARWASSNTDKLEVSMSVGKRGEISAKDPGPSTITVSVGSIVKTVDMTVNSGCIDLYIEGHKDDNPANLVAYNSVDLPLVIKCSFSNGTELDLSPDLTTFTFAAAEATIVKENGSIIIKPTAATGSQLNGTYEASGITESFTLDIFAKPLRSIVINNAPTLPQCDNSVTHALQAMGTFGEGDAAETIDITSQVAWSSLFPSVATISNAGGTEGELTTMGPGQTTTIKAELASPDLGMIEATVDVEIGPAAVTGVDIKFYEIDTDQPNDIGAEVTGDLRMPIGKPYKWGVEATMGCGPSLDKTNFTGLMAFNGGELPGVTINKSTKQIVTSDNSGTGNLRVDFTDGQNTITSPDRTLNFTKKEFTSIRIIHSIVDETIPGSTIKKWIDVGSSANFEAYGVYSDGTEDDITDAASQADAEGIHTSTITWNSDNTAIATVVSSTGAVSGVATGVVNIGASTEQDFAEAGRGNEVLSVHSNDLLEVGIKTPCADQAFRTKYSHYCYEYGALGESCVDVCSNVARIVHLEGQEAISGTNTAACLAVIQVFEPSVGSIDPTKLNQNLDCAYGGIAIVDTPDGDPNDHTGSNVNAKRVCACKNP